MIRNIVFDMGNVLIDYTPELYARRFARDERDAHQLAQAIFYSPEWMKLDEGTISFEDALSGICARLPESLRAPAEEVFYHWHERIVPVDEMTALVLRLKANGYKVYLLSNANTAFDLYKKDLPFYPHMDGCVVSAFEKLAKPDAAIYRLLTDRYKLLAEETVFIDDTKVNVEGAIACGWQGYCFADRRIDRLETALGDLGVRTENAR